MPQSLRTKSDRLLEAATDASTVMAPEDAWYSPKWYSKEKLPAISLTSRKQKAPVRFIVVLAPYEGGAVPQVKAEITQGEIGSKTLQLQLTVNGQIWDLKRSL